MEVSKNKTPCWPAAVSESSRSILARKKCSIGNSRDASTLGEIRPFLGRSPQGFQSRVAPDAQIFSAFEAEMFSGTGALSLKLTAAPFALMPISIQMAAGLISSGFVGTISGSELLQAAVEVRVIEEKEPVTPARIIDLSGMTGVELDFRAISAFAKARKESLFKNATKSAIIAPEQIQYGFARMYQMLNQNPLLEVQVFHDRVEAERWLRSKHAD